jgi:hypothetical protein
VSGKPKQLECRLPLMTPTWAAYLYFKKRPRSCRYFDRAMSEAMMMGSIAVMPSEPKSQEQPANDDPQAR